MKQATREWLKKAEADWLAALDLARRRKVPLPDQVCFHCQQCAEKYLKAIFVDSGKPHPKIHDLERLLDLVEVLSPLLAAFRPALADLSDFAVEFRYPGESATREEARIAVRETRAFRKAVRAHFSLPA